MIQMLQHMHFQKSETIFLKWALFRIQLLDYRQCLRAYLLQPQSCNNKWGCKIFEIKYIAPSHPSTQNNETSLTRLLVQSPPVAPLIALSTPSFQRLPIPSIQIFNTSNFHLPSPLESHPISLPSPLLIFSSPGPVRPIKSNRPDVCYERYPRLSKAPKQQCQCRCDLSIGISTSSWMTNCTFYLQNYPFHAVNPSHAMSQPRVSWNVTLEMST